MPPRLPKGTTFFTPGSGVKKYIAIVPRAGGTLRVSFGDQRYGHYKDQVPASMGGGEWSSLDHLDKDRRRRYRARHSAIKCKDGVRCVDVRFSPAWFSYHFLW